MEANTTKGKSKISFALMVLVFVAVAAIVEIYVFQRGNSRRIVAQNMDYITDFAVQEKRQLEYEFGMTEQLIANMAYAYGIALETGRDMEEALREFAEDTIFDRIAFISENGWDYSIEGQADVSDREYYLKGIKGETGRYYLPMSRITGKSSMVFYTPVRENGKISGVLIGHYHPETLEPMLYGQLFGNVSDAYITLQDGTVIASSTGAKKYGNVFDAISGHNFDGGVGIDEIRSYIESGTEESLPYRFVDDNSTSVCTLVKFENGRWLLWEFLPESVTDNMIKRANVGGQILFFVLVGLFVILFGLSFAAVSGNEERLNRAVTEAVARSDKNHAAVREQLAITKSFSRIYYRCYFIDLVNHKYYDVTQFDFDSLEMLGGDNAEERFREWRNDCVEETHLANMEEFTDLSTLAGRLKNTNILSIEFLAKNVGWARGNFIAARRTEDGNVTHVLFATQEIDDAKREELRMHQYLVDAYAAVNRASAAKTEFFSNMSHDIRTPINAIIGMTALAEAHLDEKEWIKNCLGKITVSSKHLLGLINEVLDMSKIEAGKMELLDEDFNMLELIDNLVDISSTLTKAKRHEFIIDIGDMEHEELVGDSGRIRQMFMNLMSNAVKYTPEGGRIRLAVSEKPTDSEGIGCYEFVFEDSGIGMSKEFIERLYEPFSRDDNAIKGKIQGTGLGMAITKNIIQMMNGDIRVESTPGVGTVFTVTIYVKLRDDGGKAENEKLKGLSVLVAENDEYCGENICCILRELGVTCEYVTSVGQAVDKIRLANENINENANENAKGYFAVIVDWDAPDGGRAAIHKIREEIGENGPAIIVSSYDRNDIEPEARTAGADAFINKPCHRIRMVHTLKELLNNDGKNSKSGTLDAFTSVDYSGKRVLLVEDNELNAEIAGEVFGMAKIEVEYAKNGQEAVDIMRNAADGYYDIVFMDIQMPVMNGIEASKAIRAMSGEYRKTVPIIAMSANAFAEDVRAVKDAGMNEHIAKPLDFNLLSATLKKWLG